MRLEKKKIQKSIDYYDEIKKFDIEVVFVSYRCYKCCETWFHIFSVQRDESTQIIHSIATKMSQRKILNQQSYKKGGNIVCVCCKCENKKNLPIVRS